jgi:hypothetical protein
MTNHSGVTKPQLSPNRRTSAPRLLLLGLICFGLWFFVDAHQLAINATNSPQGVRRNVALDILTPVVTNERAIHVFGLVDGANQLLGRTSSAASIQPTPPAPAKPHPRAPLVAPVLPGTARRDKLQSTLANRLLNEVPPALTLPPLTRLYPPSALHPLTLLSVGDSLGQDLGIGLGDVFGQDPHVRVIQGAKEATGLADTAYYNWPAEVSQDLVLYHPQIVVMMLGANDWQDFKTGHGQQAYPGTAFWRTRYAARVAKIMNEVRASGAHLIWVGLPILGPANPFPATEAPTLNAIYHLEATQHPGSLYFSTYDLFMNADHGFSEYLKNASGSYVMIRATDGVHFTVPWGDDQLGTDVVGFIDTELHLKLKIS